MFKQIKMAALAGAIALTGAIGWATPVSAQERIGLITIENASGEERRVCVYKARKINLKAERCFDIPNGKNAIWARGENRKNEPFDFKVFRKRKGLLPAKFLYEGSALPGTIVNIRIGSGFGFTKRSYAARRAPQPRYRVKFCNVTQNRTVWLAIAARDSHAAVARGYWGIAKGECETVDYTDSLKEFGGGQTARPPVVFYRAYTTGDNAQRWEGTEANEEPLVCVNPTKRFHWSLSETNGDGVKRAGMCNGEGMVKRRFRSGPVLDRQVQVGRVNF